MKEQREYISTYKDLSEPKSINVGNGHHCKIVKLRLISATIKNLLDKFIWQDNLHSRLYIEESQT